MNNVELKEARLKLGLSQQKMASAFNTPLSTYIKWEHGERRVPGLIDAVLALVFKYRGAVKHLLRKYT